MTTPLQQVQPEYKTQDSQVGAAPFALQLSVSLKHVCSKEDGKKVQQYERCTMNSQQEDALRIIFTTKNYSTNVWGGNRHSDNYIGMTGVALDFDGGFTIDEAKAVFGSYNYILHTSTSHNVDKDGMTAERFRVILPFAPGDLRFTTAAECKKVYLKLLSLYPQMDPACTDAGRQFFPFSTEKGAEFLLHINATGKHFDIDISDVADNEVAVAYEDREWDGELRPKAELDRILKFCPFVRWMDQHIDNPKTEMHEPLKFALISNLCWYEGGREEIHRILGRDCRSGKYFPGLVDDKIDRVLEFYNPQTYASAIRLGWPGPAPKKPAGPAGWGKIGTKQPREFVQLDWDDNIVVKLDDVWAVTSLEELKADLLPVSKKLPAVCPVCGSESATVKLDTFHFANIWCEKCQKAYYEHPVSPGIFAFKGELFRVEMRSNKFISPEPLKKEHFRTPEDFDYAKRFVFNDPLRSFSSDDFQMRRIGSGNFTSLGYEFDTSDNAIILRYPPLPVKVQDNAFINRFIEGMFGQYADFVRDWMALYTYTNYMRLPVIVLAGDRYAGKNTFAEMVGKIFPKLMGLWDGDVKPFNPQFTNKLLFVDENRNAHKPEQYAELKRITGNDKLPINKKFENEFNAPNNLNIIITTNDPKPIFLKWGEEPRDDKVNNFFIYECKAVPEDQIDNQLKHKLEDRLGHYVRTELKARFERLSKNFDSRSRYFIAAPITDFASDLYASSMTSVEMEAEELAEAIVLGKHETVTNDRGYEIRSIWYDPTEWNGDYYVKLKSIRDLITFLSLRSASTVKAYTEALCRLGVISMRSDYRNNKQQLGYKILRSKDYYNPGTGLDAESGKENEDKPF
ncbi:hypothetical protein EHM69_00985 [candidate division KSB1 bacterium]|nr:MAG: hypothetical protein EHM69_00985 [candidate division KSB1 bacterium]